MRTDTPTTKTPQTPLVARLGVVFLACLGIWALTGWLNATVFGGDLTIGVRLAHAAITSGLAIPMVILARRYVDRRPWAGLGLQPVRQALRPFLIGIAAFTIPSALGLTVALATGWVTLQAQVPVSQILGWAALLVVLVFFYEALPEELIFRGYLQRNLSTVLPPWVAAIGQAALFSIFGTSLWVASEGWGVLAERGIMFLAMAIVLGLLRIQTGSVWTTIGFHVAFQVFAQSMLTHRVSTNNEDGLMLSGIVSAFVLATTVAGLLHRKQVNWSRPEPE